MIPIEFVVIGLPATAGSKRAFPFKRNDGSLGVRVTDDCKRSKPWQVEVSWKACEAYKGPVLTIPLRLEITFYLPRPKHHFKTRKGEVSDQVKPGAPTYPTTKPDRTKLVRCLEDALKGIIWKDDSQVVEGFSRKLYGEPARAEVKILGVE